MVHPRGCVHATQHAHFFILLLQLIPDNEVALLGGALKFRAKVRLARRVRPELSRAREAHSAACVTKSCVTAVAYPIRGRRAAVPLPHPTHPRPHTAHSHHLQHLPGIYGVAMVAGSLLLGCALRVISFTFCGTYLAWAYLRFVQARNGVRCVVAGQQAWVFTADDARPLCAWAGPMPWAVGIAILHSCLMLRTPPRPHSLPSCPAAATCLTSIAGMGGHAAIAVQHPHCPLSPCPLPPQRRPVRRVPPGFLLPRGAPAAGGPRRRRLHPPHRPGQGRGQRAAPGARAGRRAGRRAAVLPLQRRRQVWTLQRAARCLWGWLAPLHRLCWQHTTHPCCPPSSTSYLQVAWNYGMAGGATLLGSDAGDAARRRERGAKALEERLGMAKAATAKAAAAPAAPAALAAGPAGNAAAADQAEADVESAAGGDA